MPGNIFISYRRGDEPGFAGRLYDRLEQAFSRSRIFIDVDNIPAGADFVEVLGRKVAECEVLLAIIGDEWLMRDGAGNRRIDHPEDFVRIEIEQALHLGKTIIPVLIGPIQMVREEDLPPSLKPLARRNKISVSHEHFATDCARLVQAIQGVLGETADNRAPIRKRRHALWLGTASAAAILLAGGGYLALTRMAPTTVPAGVADSSPRAENISHATREPGNTPGVSVDTRTQEAMAAAERDRLQREKDVQAKAAADTAARRAADEETRRNAETAESAQRLQEVDRQRVQIALTSLGYDTRTTSGTWDGRTREMISAWQRATSRPVSGFLPADQMQALLGQASFAIGRFDEELRAKAAIDQAARNKKEAAERAAALQIERAEKWQAYIKEKTTGEPTTQYDGRWRGRYSCDSSFDFDMVVRNGQGSFTLPAAREDGTRTLKLWFGKDTNAAFVRLYEERGKMETALLLFRGSEAQNNVMSIRLRKEDLGFKFRLPVNCSIDAKLIK